MEEGRCRDLDQVDVGRGGELLEGVGTVEEELAADGLTPEGSVELIKVVATGSKLIGKEIRERYHLSDRVLRKRRRDSGAARTAAKQTEANGRVCLITKSSTRLKQEKTRCGSRSSLEKLAAIHVTLFQCGAAVFWGQSGWTMELRKNIAKDIFQVEFFLADIFDLLRA